MKQKVPFTYTVTRDKIKTNKETVLYSLCTINVTKHDFLFILYMMMGYAYYSITMITQENIDRYLYLQALSFDDFYDSFEHVLQ